MASRKVRHGLKWALLGLLLDQNRPLYGYSLLTRTQTMLSDAAGVNAGLVYTSLNALEREGYIRAVGEQPGSGRRTPRVLYEITDAGIEALTVWFRDHYFEPVRWDLPAKLAVMTPEQVPEMLRRLDTAEDECMALIRRLGDQIADVGADPWRAPLVRLAYKYGMTQLNGRVAWLQDARHETEKLTKAHGEGSI